MRKILQITYTVLSFLSLFSFLLSIVILTTLIYFYAYTGTNSVIGARFLFSSLMSGVLFLITAFIISLVKD